MISTMMLRRGWGMRSVSRRRRRASSLLGSWSIVPRRSSLPSSSCSNDDDEDRRCRLSFSSVASEEEEEVGRLSSLRNVGVFAHVDAGKTTVTERMLSLAGVVTAAGSVDAGSTVTDHLPAERERGITIQSAAVSLDWRSGSSGRDVRLNLIDTPGHVDFAVEVNRCAAALDGAVLVLDAVAGVQAQTETVWRTISSTSSSSSSTSLPVVAVVNKMDREGRDFAGAVRSVRRRLRRSNPVPTQTPLYRRGRDALAHDDDDDSSSSSSLPPDVTATPDAGDEFCGVVDLVRRRAVLYDPSSSSSSSSPTVVPLSLDDPSSDCAVSSVAAADRADLVAALAEVDDEVAERWLEDRPVDDDLTARALRRAAVDRRLVPVLAAAALRGVGVEAVLDAVADASPSPLDRGAPALRGATTEAPATVTYRPHEPRYVTLGHPRHPSLLALAFKVVHAKNRGGSGDGRVVFVRVFSGSIRLRDVLSATSPGGDGGDENEVRTERVGGLLELDGGRLPNAEEGVCRSGGVCALVGLRTVVTGDTLSENTRRRRRRTTETTTKTKTKKKKKTNDDDDVIVVPYDDDGPPPRLAGGFVPPRPVLTVRLEASDPSTQVRLSDALRLLVVEDPSVVVEERDDGALSLSGLGELHVEVTLDRLRRDFGLDDDAFVVGPPAVVYKETLCSSDDGDVGTRGWFVHEQTISGARVEARVDLTIEGVRDLRGDRVARPPAEPVVVLADAALDEDDDGLLARALVAGVRGALRRGTRPLVDVRCVVRRVDADPAAPGALRACAARAVAATLRAAEDRLRVAEPVATVEVGTSADAVGTVLSDLAARRGTVGDVRAADDDDDDDGRASITADVPLSELLGYATELRSLTGGEATFTAEYKGHAPV